jgi:hypothetical protein
MRSIDHLADAMPNVELADLGQHLDLLAADAPQARSVSLPLLLPQTRITVRTRNTCYRMRVLDGAARRVLITGGKLFPESTEAEVVGARDDDDVKAGWIVEGLQLELATDRGPVVTSMVESVTVDVDTVSGTAEGH